jgi:hypothetical protein
MQNLHGVILTISAHRAKNAYQYQHASKKCISMTYVTTNKSIVKYFRILSSFTGITAILALKYMINRIIHGKIHIAWHIPRAPYQPSWPSALELIYMGPLGLIYAMQYGF